MFGPSKKLRLALIIEGTPIAVRFVPHNSDPTKAMIKGRGESPAAFCQAAEISHGPLFQGGDFTMVEVDKDDLAQGIATATMNVLENAIAEPKQLSPKCAGCGTDDDVHNPQCGALDFTD